MNAVNERAQKNPRRRKGRRVLCLCVLILPALIFCLILILIISPGNSNDQTASEDVLNTAEESDSANEEAESVSDQAEGTDEKPTDSDPSETEDNGKTDLVYALMDEMTLEEKVYQMFIVTPEQLTGVDTVTQAGETTRNAIEQYPVGGVVYFASNLQTPEQVKIMLSDIQSYAEYGLFLAVDEEGGSVARLGNNSAMETTQFPDMGLIGATGDVTEAYRVGLTIGSELAEFGFNLDFAPVADVNTSPETSGIGTRAFSDDAETAAAMVAACVEGFRESGTICTLKHFPGHGNTESDSHYGTAVTEKTLTELEECEFLPFRAGIDAGAEMVMVGHISLPNVSGDNTPATLSPEIITGLLREELGFDGIVVTDSMQMEAITDCYSSAEAALLAIQAGADIILMPDDLKAAADGVISATESGELSEERIDESVYRILSLKSEKGIISMTKSEI